MSTPPSRRLRAQRRSTAWASRNPCLRLDPDRDAVDPNEPVPCPAIPRDRERHLRAHWDRSRQSAPEPVEHSELASIEGRVAARYCLHNQSQANGGTCPPGLFDRELLKLRALDAAELGVRHPDPAAGDTLTQRQRDPSVADLAAQFDFRTSHIDPGLVEEADPAGHVHILRAADLSRLTWLERPASGTTDGTRRSGQ